MLAPSVCPYVRGLLARDRQLLSQLLLLLRTHKAATREAWAVKFCLCCFCCYLTNHLDSVNPGQTDRQTSKLAWNKYAHWPKMRLITKLAKRKKEGIPLFNLLGEITLVAGQVRVGFREG